MATNPETSETAPKTKAMTEVQAESEPKVEPQTEAEVEAEAQAKVDAKEKADRQDPADDRVKRHYQKMKYALIGFWVFVVVFCGGLLLTAILGILVRPETDPGLSLIWLVPLVVLAAPIIYAWVRYALVAQIAFRLLITLIVMAVMYIVIFLAIKSAYADDFWAFMAGNETMGGQLGLTGTLSVLGVVIVLILALVLPLASFAWLMKSLIEDDLNILKVLVLAIFTSLTFFFSIGLSIVNNSGF